MLKSFLYFLILATLIIKISTISDFQYSSPYDYNADLVKTVIANGNVVTGLDDTPAFQGQILINKAGKIIKVLKQRMYLPLDVLKEQFPKSEIIDANEKFVIPGGIDPHVHLEYPQGSNLIESADDFYTGSIAALCGGTTTYIDFIEANKTKKEPLRHALEKRLEKAKAKSVIDFSFHMTINYLDDTMKDQIKDIISLYGINSFKIYTSYANIKLEKNEIEEAFKILKKYGGLPILHVEDDEDILKRLHYCKTKNLKTSEYHVYCHSDISEAKETKKILELAMKVNLNQIHIVHVSSEHAKKEIELTQRKGLKVTGEVTSHNLALTDEVYKKENGADFICAPPIREQSDVDSMWQGLESGVLDFVVTDHCPFTTKQRRGLRRHPEFRNEYYENGDARRVLQPESEDERWWKKEKEPAFFDMPGGVPGIETRIFVLYQKGVVERNMPIEKFVQLISTNAAKRYRLYPKKGVLLPGSDADIVIMDPNKKMNLFQQSLHQNVDFCPYEGMKIDMKIKTVMVGGEILFDKFRLLTSKLNHRGHYLSRRSFRD